MMVMCACLLVGCGNCVGVRLLRGVIMLRIESRLLFGAAGCLSLSAVIADIVAALWGWPVIILSAPCIRIHAQALHR